MKQKYLYIVTILLLIFTSCETIERLTIVQINKVENITSASTTVNSEIIDLSYNNPNEYGICWSTEVEPKVVDQSDIIGYTPKKGEFTGKITGLSPLTEYFVRCFVKEDGGIEYSKEINFSTIENQLPIIDVGKPQIIARDTVKLQGFITDDNEVISCLWTKLSGANANILTPENDTTLVVDLEHGIYIFELKATDNNQATATAQLSITVNLEQEIGVSNVELNTDKLTLSPNEEKTLTVNILPPEATNKTVSWESDNTNVATVDDNGKITAKSVGTANITVTTDDGDKKATCEVTLTAINIPVTGVSLNTNSISLAVNEEQILTANITPPEATNKSVSWKSDNTEVATVDSNGKIIAKSVGTANITVTTNNGNKTSVCRVTVTLSSSAITDIEGNIYETVIIGTQTWMAENLKTTKYNDGIDIPYVIDNTWSDLSTAAYCWYVNDEETYKNQYGGLYNWYTVKTGKLCPLGWHVPTDDEWGTMVEYLGGDDEAGIKLRNTSGWEENGNGTNESGFNASPSGYQFYKGGFNYAGKASFWWTSTAFEDKVWRRGVTSFNSIVNHYADSLNSGYSIRCLKGEGIIPNTIPSSSFNISPESGTTGTYFTMDASASNDNEDATEVLQVRWDFENDGVWDIDYSTEKIINHQFTQSGNYTIKMEVIDTGGLTNETTQTVEVTENTSDAITDVEGNTYTTTTIGSQIWMTENLKTTKYNDGTDIPNITDNTWSDLSTSAYCWFNNDIANKDQYGALYNWYVVETDKICLSGWHVPNDDEWKTLEAFIGMNQNEVDLVGWRGTTEGSQLKSISGWIVDGNGTNEYSFNVIPSGYLDGENSRFGQTGDAAYFWTSTTQEQYSDARFRVFDSSKNGIFRDSRKYTYGMSIRCVKN